jgi:tetratricopeptide (TPR) repeat protein
MVELSPPSAALLSRVIAQGLLAFIAIVPHGSGLLNGQQPEGTPNPAEALFQVGVSNLKEKKFTEAEEAFRKLYELEPSNTRGALGVAEVYLAQKRDDEAIRFLQQVATKNPRILAYRMAIGDFAMRSGKYDLALNTFLKFLQGVDKNSKSAGELYYLVGEAYRRKGDLDFATIFLRQARDLLPGNALVVGTFGLVLDLTGKKEAAAQEYRTALNIDPNASALLNNLAFLIAENGGDMALALTYAKRARELSPNSPDGADTLGWVYVKNNMPDEAIGILRDLVQKEPARSTFHYHLAVALEQKGDHAGARQELERALTCNPAASEEQKIKELLQKIPK